MSLLYLATFGSFIRFLPRGSLCSKRNSRILQITVTCVFRSVYRRAGVRRNGTISDFVWGTRHAYQLWLMAIFSGLLFEHYLLAALAVALSRSAGYFWRCSSGWAERWFYLPDDLRYLP